MYKNKLKHYLTCHRTDWQNLSLRLRNTLYKQPKYSDATGTLGNRALSSGDGVDLVRPRHEAYPPYLHFNDGRLAMQSKSFIEILRSVVILKLCTYDVFVDNSEKVLTKNDVCGE